MALHSGTATGIDFEDRSQLKDHYNSDYHKYNLRRKVAGLPLLTPEQFERRQAQEAAKPRMQSSQAKKMGRKEKRAQKKEEKMAHKGAKVEYKIDRAEKIERGEELSEEEDEEELDEEELDEDVEVYPGASIFDNEILEDWPQCLEYMEAKFGFSIPHEDRINDMHGLCCYLQIKVNHCFRCLYSGKRFRSPEAVKDYMAAKGNRRFNSETFEEEFGRFYNRLEDSRAAEKRRLAIVEHGAWAAGGEEGTTATGKKLVSRELAWVVKQKPKPAPEHAGVIANLAEAEERQLAGWIPKDFFKRTMVSEMSRRDVDRQAKSVMRLGMKQGKLWKTPTDTMMYGK